MLMTKTYAAAWARLFCKGTNEASREKRFMRIKLLILTGGQWQIQDC